MLNATLCAATINYTLLWKYTIIIRDLNMKQFGNV
jgi:hypothetical protein